MNLQTVLARMLEGQVNEPQYRRFLAERATSSPEGKALADVVAAAEAWRDERGDIDPRFGGITTPHLALHRAIDRLREVTDE